MTAMMSMWEYNVTMQSPVTVRTRPEVPHWTEQEMRKVIRRFNALDNAAQIPGTDRSQIDRQMVTIAYQLVGLIDGTIGPSK